MVFHPPLPVVRSAYIAPRPTRLQYLPLYPLTGMPPVPGHHHPILPPLEGVKVLEPRHPLGRHEKLLYVKRASLNGESLNPTPFSSNSYLVSLESVTYPQQSRSKLHCFLIMCHCRLQRRLPESSVVLSMLYISFYWLAETRRRTGMP
jgi:hypothetical protein